MKLAGSVLLLLLLLLATFLWIAGQAQRKQRVVEPQNDYGALLCRGAGQQRLSCRWGDSALNTCGGTSCQKAFLSEGEQDPGPATAMHRWSRNTHFVCDLCRSAESSSCSVASLPPKAVRLSGGTAPLTSFRPGWPGGRCALKGESRDESARGQYWRRRAATVAPSSLQRGYRGRGLH